jgi:hypothetical protein
MFTDKEVICNKPVKAGICVDNELRFYFNNQTHACEPFIYGGCAANANNFNSSEECNKTCGGKTL